MMLPINLQTAHKAFHDKTINMWELTFLEGVHKQDDLTEKQYDTIIAIARKMLPLKLLVERNKTYRAPVDSYFGESYFDGDY